METIIEGNSIFSLSDSKTIQFFYKTLQENIKTGEKYFLSTVHSFSDIAEILKNGDFKKTSSKKMCNRGQGFVCVGVRKTKLSSFSFTFSQFNSVDDICYVYEFESICTGESLENKSVVNFKTPPPILFKTLHRK